MSAIIDDVESISSEKCIKFKDLSKFEIKFLVLIKEFLIFLIETELSESFSLEFSRYSVNDRETAESL